MRLLVITQKVDEKDAILGFFIEWLREISKHVEKVTVITSYKESYNLPKNVEVFSMGREKGRGKIGRRLKFLLLAKKHLPQADAVLAHMCPEYVVALSALNKKYKKPVYLWFTHKSVSKFLILAERQVKKILPLLKKVAVWIQIKLW